ncbi:03279c4e-1cbe-4c51-834c-e9d1716dd34b [Sclerotinia trifoliorum]|uniref:03279c4e-1cbe-4c51-834c-e9d1716dd34b n=1 Tax=Sclerotinia trifoliorum TaxID=28548 RepID=A0A8H2ZSY0_9HELO|nr:03279c4e-1cbe-4c51-834c-e9d1716dd34b [Sclerotinia trifoliorum]
MAEIETEIDIPEYLRLLKDPETRILDANNAVVTTLHITKFHIIIALDSGILHILKHENGRDIGGEIVVKACEMGIWCVDSWEGEENEEWIVVGGTGNEDNLKVCMWDGNGRLVRITVMSLQCRPLVEKLKLQGHKSTVRVVKAPSATTVISASRDATIRIWNIQNGICEAVLEGHTKTIRCLDVHEKIAVSGSYDSEARVWDLKKRVCLHVMKGHESKIYAIATNGVKVFTGGMDKSVRVWDVITGECQAILEGFTSLVGLLELLPSSLLTADASGVIRLFANQDCKEIWKVEAHQNAVISMHCHGSKFATGGSDGKVRVWDLDNGKLLQELITSNAVWYVKWIGNSLVTLFSNDIDNTMEVIMKIWTVPS